LEFRFVITRVMMQSIPIDGFTSVLVREFTLRESNVPESSSCA